MWSASLYLKDPAGARFVAGGPAEVELLLGSPLPSLPPPDREGGRSVFAVRFHPQLRTLLLHFLQGLLSQIGAEGAAPPDCAGRVAFLAGTRENTALVDALLDDGFAFTELSISDVDFNQFLAANKRYRLSADVFFELYSILVRETERRLREGDRGLLARMARHLPDLPKEHWQTPAGAARVMMNSHVLPYLLADAWTTGTRLMASARIKAEADKRRPAEIVDAFLDLISGVKRFEILAHVRDQVVLHGPFGASLDDRVSKGM